ncbi:diaminobutyrate--2-oxoglutarate transaminase [Aliamphritea hakodatensis]|uniref:diaminobutyrate--2-oxoglutarate transaminase n=1 Tax=Aliamphritea hakodatensis TaxID=2895352 RepID=UPI0022FD62B8|nr:diaminobutyrate--2-oxoglutarate transaminase [Aliamphritea hakodatensis]
MYLYKEVESVVRGYCRSFPIELKEAKGSIVKDSGGVEYLDFLMGCGSLNYGHNDPDLKQQLLEYIGSDGVAMSLDFYSTAKTDFLFAFNQLILKPRNLQYKVQFTGPTGANAIEAAVKLAKKVTGRSDVITFTNGFHGCSLGALSLTGNKFNRGSQHNQLPSVLRLPYDNYNAADAAIFLDYVRTAVGDPSSGIDAPAAIVVECIQGEGGLNVASADWLKKIRHLADALGCLLIVDDIQAGCGRSGDFFSFEFADIRPDIVTLAKSISGFGLPMSLVLINPVYDSWSPAEHNGTFRGNNHAFVTATAALKKYWSDASVLQRFRTNALYLENKVQTLCDTYTLGFKGKGMMLGIDLYNSEDAHQVQKYCFENKLIVERCGPFDEVLKFLPALNVSREEIDQAINTVQRSVEHMLAKKYQRVGNNSVLQEVVA